MAQGGEEPSGVQLEDLKREIGSGVAATVSRVALISRDVEQRMHDLAALQSAEYATDHMLCATPFRDGETRGRGRLNLLESALRQVEVDGVYAEFGVHRGASLEFIARRIDKVVYGFDSFEGLSAPWSTNFPKGIYDLQGEAPQVRVPNHRIVKGWFADTLPMFNEKVAGPASFLHIDCYLYDSTRQVLEGLSDRIGRGCVLVFGQYFNHPGWRSGQFKAFQAFCEAAGLKYRYLGYATAGSTVSLIIT